jgi:hypothetical protein
MSAERGVVGKVEVVPPTFGALYDTGGVGPLHDAASQIFSLCLKWRRLKASQRLTVKKVRTLKTIWSRQVNHDELDRAKHWFLMQNLSTMLRGWCKTSVFASDQSHFRLQGPVHTLFYTRPCPNKFLPTNPCPVYTPLSLQNPCTYKSLSCTHPVV